MDATTIGLVVGVSVLMILLLVLVIYWSITLHRWVHFIDAVDGAVENDCYCVKDEGPCRLLTDDTLPIPEVFPDTFSYEIARYSADLVARVELLFRDNYSVPELVMPPGMVKLKALYFNKEIIGFIGVVGGVYWIAFRGTSTSEEWKKDFQFMQNDTVIYNSTNNHSNRQQRLFSYSKSPKISNLSCHEGFVDVFDQVKDDIHEVLKNVAPGSTIVVSGHSLGSAISTLTCLDLQSKYTVLGYCFGTPRVCSTLPTVYMKAFFRINNTCDPVKEIPLSVMWNMYDKKQPYFYEHGGGELLFTSQRQSLTNNHLMPVYIEAIENRTLKNSE
jgi:hypothetical protein